MVQAGPKQRITTAEFAAKFRSKYEVYQFLTIDALAYLPPPECVTIYFLKDLVRGVKGCKYQFDFLTSLKSLKQRIPRTFMSQCIIVFQLRLFLRKVRKMSRFVVIFQTSATSAVSLDNGS